MQIWYSKVLYDDLIHEIYLSLCYELVGWAWNPVTILIALALETDKIEIQNDFIRIKINHID